MRRNMIEHKLKSLAAFLIILIFLPYVISVFVNGIDITAEDKEPSLFVKVKVPETEEADGIAEVNWTEYVAGVLAEETGEDIEMEALKAQAVLVRTEIYRQMKASEDKVVDSSWMTRDEMREKWGEEKFRINYKKYVDAVKQTDDTVLFYNNEYAWTPFHQASIGKTRSAQEVMGTEEYPYIAVRECPLDKDAPGEIGIFTFTCKEIQELCKDFLVAASDGQQAENGFGFDDFEIVSTDAAGYVKELRIGETVCTGDQFRDALSLPSSSFSFSQGKKPGKGEHEDKTEIRITVTGKGHGLGMSLWTANQMAKEGKTYEEILAFFFEGTELKNDQPETGV